MQNECKLDVKIGAPALLFVRFIPHFRGLLLSAIAACEMCQLV